MEGVGQHDLRAEVVGQHIRPHGLDGGGSAHWHEDWRFDDAVRGVQAAATGGAIRGKDFKREGHAGRTFKLEWD